MAEEITFDFESLLAAPRSESFGFYLFVSQILQIFPTKSNMKTIASIAVILTVIAVVSASQQDSRTDVSGRTHNDIAARVNLGTAISLVVPIALGVALVALLAPIFQSLFASPIPFGPSVGYARKGKSLFSSFNQENIMQVLDTLTKAIDTFAEADAADKAKPKL